MQVNDILVDILILVVPAAVGFGGVVLGNFLSRRNAREMDRRWNREESMRLLRWAIELNINEDQMVSDMGLSALTALLESDLLQAIDKPFAAAIMTAARARSLKIAFDQNSAADYNRADATAEEII